MCLFISGAKIGKVIIPIRKYGIIISAASSVALLMLDVHEHTVPPLAEIRNPPWSPVDGEDDRRRYGLTRIGRLLPRTDD